MAVIVALLLLPLLAAASVPLVVKQFAGKRIGWILAIIPLMMLCLVLSQSVNIVNGVFPTLELPWFKAMDVVLAFRIDGLSQLMLLLISGIGLPIVIYSQPYFGEEAYIGRYYIFLFIFITAMTGAVCANDLLTLFIFWELTSFCSFLLISLKHRYRTVRKAAIEALFITTIGGLCLLTAFILVIEFAGNQPIDQLVRSVSIADSPFYPWIFVLFLIGAFTKSAQFPFGFWLPGAMRAPTPVSAYLHSATMVQLGIYILGRFHPLFAETDWWFTSLATIGSISMLTSIFLAFKHFDMKLILAYTTITALGSLVITLASNHESIIKASVFFVLVHALYKANLFMAVGDIQHQTGSRHLKRVGGLHRAMPVTFLAMCVAGSSMAGLPPLLGFYVKELLYEASLSIPVAASLQTFIIILANMMMAAVAFILVIKPFWGEQRPVNVREADVNMSVNALILAITTVVLSFFTKTLDIYILTPAAESILGRQVTEGLTVHVGIFNKSFLLSLVTLTGACFIYLIKHRLRAILRKRKIVRWAFPKAILAGMLKASVLLAREWTRLWQSGYLNRYMAIAFLSFCLLLGYEVINLPFKWSFSASPLLFNVLMVWFLVSSGALLWIKRFISGLIALAVFGLGLALFFVIQGAPDLAMTQILVEVLVVVLIVFSLSGLINWPNMTDETAWHRISRGAIALGFGLLVAVGVQVVLTVPFDNTVGHYFIEQSKAQGFAKNIVNAILVNFRALDTLGETIVVLLGALAVFSLLGVRPWRHK